MRDLVERLEDGCVLRPKRWSGDTHADLGGSIDEEATDALLREAAAALRRVSEAPLGRVDMVCARDAVVIDELENPDPLNKQWVRLIIEPQKE